jgi:thioredoxin-like negative regulator of GroEL
VSAAGLLLAACAGLAQRSPSPIDQDHESFFGWHLLGWVLIPFIVLIVYSWSQRKPKRTVREYGAADFESEVLHGDVPTLVHFYRGWSIGDQVMIAQVEKLARSGQGVFRVGYVDLERHAELLGLCSHGEAPALLLFAGGRRIWQCEGVFDEADVLRDVLDALQRDERSRARGATGAG